MKMRSSALARSGTYMASLPLSMKFSSRFSGEHLSKQKKNLHDIQALINNDKIPEVLKPSDNFVSVSY